MGETGYGISTQEAGDANYPPLIVDIATQQIHREGFSWSFAEFVAAFSKSQVL